LPAPIHDEEQMPTDQQPDSGGVPTSSSRNRFANKRMMWIAICIAAVVVLVMVYGLALQKA
jgi:hypothetical protein